MSKAGTILQMREINISLKRSTLTVEYFGTEQANINVAFESEVKLRYIRMRCINNQLL